MKAKRITLAIVLVLICVLLTACSTPEGTYKQAQTLLSQGKYSEAAEKFESLGSYEDATTLTMYCKACALCESGNFEAGIAGFESLGNYKDCSLRISYYTARSWDDNSVGTTEFEWMNRAKSIYNENPLYLDSAERITALDTRIETAKKTLYDDAVAAAEQGQYNTAIATFQRLGNYKDSAQRATYYGIRADEDALAGTTDETAYDAVAARYTKMGEYLDCADRAASMTAKAATTREDKYASAITLAEQGQYSTAITTFQQLGNYKDSAKRAIYYGIRNDEAKLAGTTDEAAFDAVAARYVDMGDYLDCANRATTATAQATAIRDDKYDTAKALLQAGKYKEAYEAFRALNGHKDSEKQAEVARQQYQMAKLEKATVGSYVIFGVYEQDNNTSNGKEPIEWLVLAKENNRLLVISRYTLDSKYYHHSYVSITWENCTLRKWLNNDFLNVAFTSTEQAMIPTVRVSADRNPDYRTTLGDTTLDKVFLLSIAEANKYFASDSAMQCKPTAYATAQGADDYTFYWWLRTPGDNVRYAAFVDKYGISERGCTVTYEGSGVRPVMWINLEP